MEPGAEASSRQGPSGAGLVIGGTRLYSFDPETGHFQEVKAAED
jgi:hypothetical protein